MQNNNEDTNHLSDQVSAREVALKLAKLNVPILPLCSHYHSGCSEQHKKTCSRPGKAPQLKDWPTNATTDPQIVNNWFNRQPNINIGAVLGSRSRIVAIDVDGEFGRIKLDDLSMGELPPTWEFETPGNGYRYLYSSPSNYKYTKKDYPSPNGGHEELAFLGDGQYTVMPGSIHANGRPYIWREGRSPDNLPITPAPDWLLCLMSASYSADHLFGDAPSTVDIETQSEASLSVSTSTSTPTSMYRTMKEGEVFQNLQTLNRIADKCLKVKTGLENQGNGGCDESTWFHIVSLLSRLGEVEEAKIFSQLSLKHDSHSEARINHIGKDAEAKKYGPHRCTTFGCGQQQIERCFSSVNQNMQGEITNSPAHFFTLKGELGKVENLLKQSRYRVQDGKLGETTFNKKGEAEGFSSISNFIVIPTRDVCVDNGAELLRSFEFEGVLLSDGQRLPPLRVKHSDFTDLKWITDWGLAPNLEPGPANKEKMRHAIQQLAKNAQSVNVYAHLGFRNINGKWRYLHAGGCVGEANIQVEVDTRLSKYTLPDHINDIKSAVFQSLELLKLAEPRVTLPLLALTYLAPLCELLRQLGIEPSFLVWLYGLTGSRKSTLAALFLCHFGTFTAKSPPASFKDTAMTIERRSFDCKDSVFWIDDFHPTSSPQEARKMEQTAQYIIRSYGDRVGRGRMRSDSSLRPDSPPRGLALNTGEQEVDGHSSNSRLLGIELKPTDIDLIRLTNAQHQSHQLSEAMAGYVSWLGERMDDSDFGKRIKETFEAKRNEALPSQSHGRIAETASWLYLGLQCLYEFAVEKGVLSDPEKDVRLTEGWDTLLSLSSTQSEQINDVRPTQQFISVLSSMLSNGTIHVLPIDNSERKIYEGIHPPGNHVGWSDRQYFYFLPEIVYNEVSVFLSRQDERIPLKREALWKQLEEEGCLEPEKSQDNGRTKVKRSRRKTVDGRRVPTIWIKRECLEELDEGSANRGRSRPVPTRSSAQAEGPFSDA